MEEDLLPDAVGGNAALDSPNVARIPQVPVSLLIEEGSPGIELPLRFDIEASTWVEREPVASCADELRGLAVERFVDDFDQRHHSASEFRHDPRAVIKDLHEPLMSHR